MKIGERIKLERERKGWTQEEMAARCGYKGKSSISKIESSGDEITSKKVKLCAEVLGVPVSYLMGWEVSSTFDRILSERITDEQRSVLDEIFVSSTNPEYDEVGELINALHSRPEMKTLFRSAKNASKEQIEAVAQMLESFKTNEVETKKLREHEF